MNHDGNAIRKLSLIYMSKATRKVKLHYDQLHTQKRGCGSSQGSHQARTYVPRVVSVNIVNIVILIITNH